MNLIILLFTMLPCYNRSLIVQRMLLKQSMDHSNWSLIQVHQSIAFVPKHCSLPSRNGIQTFLYALRMVRKWLSRPLEMLSFKWLIKMALPMMLFCMTVCTYHLSIPIFYQSNNYGNEMGSRQNSVIETISNYQMEANYSSMNHSNHNTSLRCTQLMGCLTASCINAMDIVAKNDCEWQLPELYMIREQSLESIPNNNVILVNEGVWIARRLDLINFTRSAAFITRLMELHTHILASSFHLTSVILASMLHLSTSINMQSVFSIMPLEYLPLNTLKVSSLTMCKKHSSVLFESINDIYTTAVTPILDVFTNGTQTMVVSSSLTTWTPSVTNYQLKEAGPCRIPTTPMREWNACGDLFYVRCVQCLLTHVYLSHSGLRQWIVQLGCTTPFHLVPKNTTFLHLSGLPACYQTYPRYEFLVAKFGTDCPRGMSKANYYLRVLKQSILAWIHSDLDIVYSFLPFVDLQLQTSKRVLRKTLCGFPKRSKILLIDEVE